MFSLPCLLPRLFFATEGFPVKEGHGIPRIFPKLRDLVGGSKVDRFHVLSRKADIAG